MKDTARGQRYPDLRNIPRVDKPISRDNPLFCAEFSHARQPAMLWDMHYGLEMGIVLSGTMRRINNGGEVVVRAGGVWLCGMWEPHAYAIPSSGCRVIVCIIWPPFLAEMRFSEAPAMNWMAPFTCDVRHQPQARTAHRKRFLDLGKRFSRALKEPEPERKEWLHLLVLETLLELTRGWSPPHRNEAFSGNLLERLNKAISLIFSNPSRTTAAQAAARCGMNRNRFNVLFREYMGVSFSDFGIRHRLSRAAEQLLNSQDPIKSVARAWGFTDESHLHHLFRQHYGLTPRQYCLQSRRSMK